jgi:hypothetical protein
VDTSSFLQDSQCGTVIDVNIDCAVKLIGTNCIIYPVNSKDLQHIWVSCLFSLLSALMLFAVLCFAVLSWSLLPNTALLGQTA